MVIPGTTVVLAWGVFHFLETISSDAHCKQASKRVGRSGQAPRLAYGRTSSRWTLASIRIQARTCGMEADKAKL